MSIDEIEEQFRISTTRCVKDCVCLCSDKTGALLQSAYQLDVDWRTIECFQWLISTAEVSSHRCCEYFTILRCRPTNISNSIAATNPPLPYSHIILGLCQSSLFMITMMMTKLPISLKARNLVWPSLPHETPRTKTHEHSKNGQELIRRWDTRTWRDVSSYMITYLPLNYDTSVVLRNIFEVTCTYLMDVGLRKAPCVSCYCPLSVFLHKLFSCL